MMTGTTIAVKITIIKNKTKTKNYESIESHIQSSKC